MPTGTSKDGPQHVIVVSYDGSYKLPKSTFRVVNPQWVDCVVPNDHSSLAKYTFVLEGFTFMVFGKST